MDFHVFVKHSNCLMSGWCNKTNIAPFNEKPGLL